MRTTRLLAACCQVKDESSGEERVEKNRRMILECLELAKEFRPDFVVFSEIALQPLPDGDSRALVANLLEIESLPEAFRKTVLDKAGGNPLFIEEVVRMLVARDLIQLVVRCALYPGRNNASLPQNNR